MLSKVIKYDRVAEGKTEELAVRVLKQNAALSPKQEELLKKAEASAEQLLADAQKKAGDIIKNALEMAAEEVEKLKEEAYKTGYQQAINEARSEADAIRRQAVEILHAAHAEKKQILIDAEDDLRRLTVRLTEQLMAKQLDRDQTAVISLVKEAVNKSCESREYQIYVNQQDLTLLKEQKAELRELLPEGTSLAFIADSSLEKGSCRVVTENSVADASRKVRLDALKNFLLG